jgi:CDP-diacylglycerol---serine O-phosphatidyltransferase
MKNIKYIFPNALTLINLLFGCAAIITVFRGENEYIAGWLIFLAALFDFLDGFVAKALNAKSDFGVQLDSLADVVSFGVAPSIILFHWIILVLTKLSDLSTFEIVSASLMQDAILFCSMLFVVGAALRLARFNVKDLDQTGFRGLPTPAAAMIVASVWLVLGSTENESVRAIILNIYFVLALILLLVGLMVSTLPMISLKFEGFGIIENTLRYVLICSGIVLILIFKVEGILFTLLLYLVLSLLSGLIKSIRA